jgi:CHASE2 domain-containing sensor protein
LLARFSFLARPGWRGAGLGLVCALAGWLLALMPPLRAVDDGMLDAWFTLRGVRSPQTPIVLVGLDDTFLEDLHKEGSHLSPELAAVVGHLNKQGAVAIGLDLLIPESLSAAPAVEARGESGEAAAMGLAIIDARNVVLPELRVRDHWQPPLLQWRLKALNPDTREPTDLGFVNLTEDTDGLVRRQQLLTRDENGPVPQFALALACRARRQSFTWDDGGHTLRAGDESIPLDAEQTLRINFAGPPGTFLSLRFGDVLDRAKANHSVPEVKGAVVIIGLTGPRGQDEHATPYANALARALCGRRPELMAGSELQANVLATLLDRAYLAAPGWRLLLPLVLVSGALVGAGLARLRPRPALALAVAYPLGWVAVSFAAFAWGSWRIEVVPVVLTGLLTGVAVAVVRRRSDASERIRQLKAKLLAHPDARLQAFVPDLQVLEQAVKIDASLPLNQMRRITEKVLRQLCDAKDIAVGTKPGLEELIVALKKAGAVPKNVEVHVRAIQDYVNPASHHQDAPFSQAHVRIAQQALVELLDWYATATGPLAVAQRPPLC